MLLRLFINLCGVLGLLLIHVEDQVTMIQLIDSVLLGLYVLVEVIGDESLTNSPLAPRSARDQRPDPTLIRPLA